MTDSGDIDKSASRDPLPDLSTVGDVSTHNDVPEHHPAQIGSFRVIGIVGKGAMGIVYRAQQQSPNRTVAVKVMASGMATAKQLHRFSLEGEVLGRLQHPGIAQIYEAGKAETPQGTRAYLAMEYIEGTPLTAYAEKNSLTHRERIDLLIKICEAVHHAHEKGIVHRDLKPENILVDTTGQPKVLDFGIARAMDTDIQVTTIRTDVGIVMGTLPYMSPEQATGRADELDARSDIYAIGVIAYELLAGSRPYDLEKRAFAEALRIIREEEPARLSSVNRILRGDLEVIVGKALEKEKVRRYASTLAVADDFRRYLNDQPIAAKPPSIWYRARKFTRRNRVLVGAVTVTVVLLMWLSTQMQHTSRQAEQLRQTEANAIVEQIASVSQGAEILLSETLSPDDRETVWRGFSDQLKRARERLDAGEYLEDPLLEFWSSMMLGAAQMNALDSHQATLDMRRAITKLQETHSPACEHVIEGLSFLAALHGSRGEYEQALLTSQNMLRISRAVHKEEHADTIDALAYAARCLFELGRHDEAITHIDEIYAMSSLVAQVDSMLVAQCLDMMVASLCELDRWEDALEKAELGAEWCKANIDDDQSMVAHFSRNIALLLDELDEVDRAVSAYEKALTLYNKHFSAEHDEVIRLEFGLADTLTRSERYAESELVLKGLDRKCKQTRSFRAKHWTNVMAGFSKLYFRWNVSEPGAGHDMQMAEWNRRYDEWENLRRRTELPSPSLLQSYMTESPDDSFLIVHYRNPQEDYGDRKVWVHPRWQSGSTAHTLTLQDEFGWVAPIRLDKTHTPVEVWVGKGKWEGNSGSRVRTIDLGNCGCAEVWIEEDVSGCVFVLDTSELGGNFETVQRLINEYLYAAYLSEPSLSRINELRDQLLKQLIFNYNSPNHNGMLHVLHEFALEILTSQSLQYRDLDLALQVARIANKKRVRKRPYIPDTYARALFAKGDYVSACLAQKEALSGCASWKEWNGYLAAYKQYREAAANPVKRAELDNMRQQFLRKFVPGNNVSWSPHPIQAGQTVVITYNTTNDSFLYDSLLEKADEVFIHLGYGGWAEDTIIHERMTKTSDSRWEYTFVPPDDATQVDFVFADGDGNSTDTRWDNNTGRDWSVLVQ